MMLRTCTPRVTHIGGPLLSPVAGAREGFSERRRFVRAFSAQPKEQDQETTTLQYNAHSPVRRELISESLWLSATGLTGFGITAASVFGDGSANPFAQCHLAVHDWVISHIPPPIRDKIFEHTISNSFIEIDLIVGCLTLVSLIILDSRQGLKSLGLIGVLFTAGVGSHTYEGWLLHFLKAKFQRVRPQPELTSFSFPSGHVTSAVCLTGALVIVLLPVLKEQLPSSQSLLRLMDWISKWRYQIWGLSFLCTASGRVGGDVHWTSDTLAGCCLGVALTGCLSFLHCQTTSFKNSRY